MVYPNTDHVLVALIDLTGNTDTLEKDWVPRVILIH